MPGYSVYDAEGDKKNLQAWANLVKKPFQALQAAGADQNRWSLAQPTMPPNTNSAKTGAMLAPQRGPSVWEWVINKLKPGNEPPTPEEENQVLDVAEQVSAAPRTTPTSTPTFSGKAGKPAAPVNSGMFDELKGMIEKYQNKKTNVDLAPLLALTDSWTGSQLTRSYDRPLTEEDKQDNVLRMRSRLAEQEAARAAELARLSQQIKHQDELIGLERAKVNAMIDKANMQYGDEGGGGKKTSAEVMKYMRAFNNDVEFVADAIAKAKLHADQYVSPDLDKSAVNKFKTEAATGLYNKAKALSAQQGIPLHEAWSKTFQAYRDAILAKQAAEQ